MISGKIGGKNSDINLDLEVCCNASFERIRMDV